MNDNNRDVRAERLAAMEAVCVAADRVEVHPSSSAWVALHGALETWRALPPAPPEAECSMAVTMPAPRFEIHVHYALAPTGPEVAETILRILNDEMRRPAPSRVGG